MSEVKTTRRKPRTKKTPEPVKPEAVKPEAIPEKHREGGNDVQPLDNGRVRVTYPNGITVEK